MRKIIKILIGLLSLFTLFVGTWLGVNLWPRELEPPLWTEADIAVQEDQEKNGYHFLMKMTENPIVKEIEFNVPWVGLFTEGQTGDWLEPTEAGTIGFWKRAENEAPVFSTYLAEHQPAVLEYHKLLDYPAFIDLDPTQPTVESLILQFYWGSLIDHLHELGMTEIVDKTLKGDLEGAYALWLKIFALNRSWLASARREGSLTSAIDHLRDDLVLLSLLKAFPPSNETQEKIKETLRSWDPLSVNLTRTVAYEYLRMDHRGEEVMKAQWLTLSNAEKQYGKKYGWWDVFLNKFLQASFNQAVYRRDLNDYFGRLHALLKNPSSISMEIAERWEDEMKKEAKETKDFRKSRFWWLYNPAGTLLKERMPSLLLDKWDFEQFESVQKTHRELLQAYEKIPIQPVTIPPGATECRGGIHLLAELPRGVKTRDSRTLRYGGIQLRPDGLGVFFRMPLWTGFRGGVVFNGKLQTHCEDTSLFVRYSNDGRHYVYRCKQGGQWRIVYDGTAGEPYDEVTEPDLSATGEVLAFGAKKGDRSFIVLNGREVPSKSYDKWPQLSPDGKKIAYRAQREGQWSYIVDGTEGKPYDQIEEGFFLAEGGFAYSARRGTKWVAVVDGKESPEYDNVRHPYLASAGIIQALKDGQWSVVVKGKPGPAYESVGWMTLSPDKKRLAYEAVKDGKKRMVVDGREGKAYDEFGLSLKFSPDGKEFAYVAKEGNQIFLVRNGRETRLFQSDKPSSMSLAFEFNPKGGKLAYESGNSDNSKSFVVVEETKGKEYDIVHSLEWSPDGRHLAYAAWEEGDEFLVIDGKEGRRYDGILRSFHLKPPRFSPDGRFVSANVLIDGRVYWIRQEVGCFWALPLPP